jgi:hypothetical protein
MNQSSNELCELPEYVVIEDNFSKIQYLDHYLDMYSINMNIYIYAVSHIGFLIYYS